MTAPPPADSGSAGSSPGPYDPYHSTPAQPGYRAYQGQPGWGYPADPGYGAPQQAALVEAYDELMSRQPFYRPPGVLPAAD